MNEYANRAVTETTVQGFRRVSWGAVFAGLVVALVTQLTLNILGLGLGTGMLNFQDNEPDRAIGIGAAVWVIATSLISLFLGGWTAGRLAGVPRGADSWLHGILTWSAYTLIVFSLLTTAVGGLISGLAGVLGKGLEASGHGIAKEVPKAMGAAGLPTEQQQGQGQGGVNWDAIKDEAKQWTQSNEPGEAGQNAQELRQAMERFFNRSGEVNPQDREALVNAVAKSTGKSKEEAEQQVARWEQTYQDARQKSAEFKEKAEQKTREVATTAAHGISKGALWTFAIMVVSAIAAGLGGIAGRPKPILVETTRPV